MHISYPSEELIILHNVKLYVLNYDNLVTFGERITSAAHTGHKHSVKLIFAMYLSTKYQNDSILWREKNGNIALQ